MADYGHSNMAVLFYHLSDSYTTSETNSRGTYYSVSGIPDVHFDGPQHVVGGGTNMYPYYQPIILDHVEDPPYVEIDLSGSSITETGGTLNVHLEALQQITQTNCVIQYVIIQEDIIGEDFLVRDLLTSDNLTITNPGQTQDIVKTFTINPGWYGGVNSEDIGAVVFVQSNWTKSVLNAATLSKVDVEITPESVTVPMGSDLNFTAHITNITPWVQPIRAWLDVVLPNGNDLPSNPFEGPVSLNLQANAVIDHPMTIAVPSGIPVGDYQLRLGVGNQTNSNDDWEYDYMTVTVTP